MILRPVTSCSYEKKGVNMNDIELEFVMINHKILITYWLDMPFFENSTYDVTCSVLAYIRSKKTSPTMVAIDTHLWSSLQAHRES